MRGLFLALRVAVGLIGGHLAAQSADATGAIIAGAGRRATSRFSG